MNLNISEHSKILKAYIDRLTMKDLKEILFQVETCKQEQLNGSNKSQQIADTYLQIAIMNALGGMLTSDRDNIGKVIKSTIERESA